MKKLIYIFPLIVLYGCLFDNSPPSLAIRNNSDEAVYVYFQCGNPDSLPLSPGLELFSLPDTKRADTMDNPVKLRFVSPEYRINAYSFGSVSIEENKGKPCLPCKEKEATLFFIPETTMRNYIWKEIHNSQMFVKRITLDEKALNSMDWRYTYDPFL